MSLISTKNLVAPLANKLHMIAILLLTVGFVTLRLSGGSVKLENTKTHVQRESPEGLADLPPLEMKRNPARTGNSKTNSSADGFSKLVREVKPPWEEKKAAPALPNDPPPVKKRGGLDDIEKALGMR